MAEERDPDDLGGALPRLQFASVAGRSAVRGREARRVQRLGGRAVALPLDCAASEGDRQHKGVLTEGRDRYGLRSLAG